MSEELEGKHGVQSLEVGMGILKPMVGGKRSMMLKDIAEGRETGDATTLADSSVMDTIKQGMTDSSS